MSATAPEPAWFYSSLAQSAAAILGILGAILITRVHAQIAEGARRRPLFTRAVKAWRRGIRDAHQSADRFLAASEAQSALLASLLGDQASVPASISMYVTLVRAIENYAIILTPERVARHRAAAAIAPALVDLLDRGVQVNGCDGLIAWRNELAAFNAGEAAGEGVGAIRGELFARSNAVIAASGHLRNATDLFLPRGALQVMGYFFWVGVLVPLFWLAPPAPVPVLSLTGVAIGGLVVIRYLRAEVTTLYWTGHTEDFDAASQEIDFAETPA